MGRAIKRQIKEEANEQFGTGAIEVENITKLTLTVPEMAKALSIGINGAYDLVHREGFPKIRIGNRIVIPIRALEDWLMGNSREKTS